MGVVHKPRTALPNRFLSSRLFLNLLFTFTERMSKMIQSPSLRWHLVPQKPSTNFSSTSGFIHAGQWALRKRLVISMKFLTHLLMLSLEQMWTYKHIGLYSFLNTHSTKLVEQDWIQISLSLAKRLLFLLSLSCNRITHWWIQNWIQKIFSSRWLWFFWYTFCPGTHFAQPGRSSIFCSLSLERTGRSFESESVIVLGLDGP